MKKYHRFTTTLTISLAGLFLLLVVQNCQKNTDSEIKIGNANSGIDSEVRKAVNDAYTLYTKSNPGWTNYYDDTYTVITGGGRSLTQYTDSLRKQWENIYEKYKVVVLNHGEPTIHASGNQALHYNTAAEMFINKATNDIVRNNTGTWIALWEKQADDSWKIVLETYQAE